jgi:hypothetical protein
MTSKLYARPVLALPDASDGVGLFVLAVDRESDKGRHRSL